MIMGYSQICLKNHLIIATTQPGIMPATREPAMLRILHISDSHAQSETMQRLNELARQQSDCDVVAHTGDCVSRFCDRLPSEWDEWPQRVKLSVPGNHGDHTNTFESLHTWIHWAPWVISVDDLLFLGLHLNKDEWCSYLTKARSERADSRAIVLLTHYRPPAHDGTRFAHALADFVDGRELLILHGDEHPKGFSGAV